MFETLYKLCESNDWSKTKINKVSKIPIKEIQEIFLSEPLKVLTFNRRALIFLGGAEYADLIEKYKNQLEKEYINNPRNLSLSLKDDLKMIFEKEFKKYTFEFLQDFCQKYNWDRELIKKNFKDLNLSYIKYRSYPENEILLEIIIDKLKEDSLKLLNSSKETLIFIGGVEFSNLVKQYSRELEEECLKNNLQMPIKINDLEKIIKKIIIKSISFEDLKEFCQKNDWDKSKILLNISEITKSEEVKFNILEIRSKFFEEPAKVLELERNGLNFLFPSRPIEILLNFKLLILKMIENSTKFEFDFPLIRKKLVYFFQKLILKCNYNFEVFEKNCNKLGVDVESLKNTLKELKREINHMQSKDKIDLKEYQNPSEDKNQKKIPQTYIVLEKLLNTNSNEVRNSIITNSTIEDYVLKNAIHDFLIAYYFEKYKEKRVILDEIFTVYYKEKNKEKQLREQKIREKEKLEKLRKKIELGLENAKTIINLFLSSDCESRMDFCNKENITLKEFEKSLKLVEKGDSSLYELYLKKMESIRDQSYKKLIETVRKIISLIKNGIIENDIIRPFNLLDYYQMTHMDRTKFLEFCKENLTYLDVNIFKKFLQKYEYSRILNSNDIYSILNSNRLVQVELDENGKVIPNTGRLITKEEQKKVFAYLKENNIPLYDYCYEIALKRYINGILVFEEKKK